MAQDLDGEKLFAIDIMDLNTHYFTLVKKSRIYTGQYTFPILLLNDDNMLGEHKGREKNPGFTSIKVQNVDFLKKPSVDNIFFSSLMFS